MICGHPECTGVHAKSRPMAEWCPRTRERHTVTNREAQARYKRTAKGMLTDLRYEATQRGNR